MRLLSDRAAIYFDMTDIDGTNARLIVDDGATVALEDLTAVRITATIPSDDRVVHEAEKEDASGSSQTTEKTVRKRRFRWLKRDSSSAYAAEGTGVLRNDAAADGPMENAATELREQKSSLGSGIRATIPWLAWNCHLGERICEIDGRDAEMPGCTGEDTRYPHIRAIWFDFHVQVTQLALVP